MINDHRVCLSSACPRRCTPWPYMNAVQEAPQTWQHVLWLLQFRLLRHHHHLPVPHLTHLMLLQHSHPAAWLSPRQGNYVRRGVYRLCCDSHDYQADQCPANLPSGKAYGSHLLCPHLPSWGCAPRNASLYMLHNLTCHHGATYNNKLERLVDSMPAQRVLTPAQADDGTASAAAPHMGCAGVECSLATSHNADFAQKLQQLPPPQTSCGPGSVTSSTAATRHKSSAHTNAANWLTTARLGHGQQLSHSNSQGCASMVQQCHANRGSAAPASSLACCACTALPVRQPRSHRAYKV